MQRLTNTAKIRYTITEINCKFIDFFAQGSGPSIHIATLDFVQGKLSISKLLNPKTMNFSILDSRPPM